MSNTSSLEIMEVSLERAKNPKAPLDMRSIVGERFLQGMKYFTMSPEAKRDALELLEKTVQHMRGGE